MSNIDQSVIDDFGKEWERYDQSKSNLKLDEAFNQYFSIFPKSFLNKTSIGFDAGCGSGRWAKFIAPQISHLHCIEPSEKALNIAQRNLKDIKNVSFECASINDSTINNDSYDFGYSKLNFYFYLKILLQHSKHHHLYLQKAQINYHSTLHHHYNQ